MVISSTPPTSSKSLIRKPANSARMIIGTEFELDIEPEYTVKKIKELIEERKIISPVS
jgi:hypothetical protein